MTSQTLLAQVLGESLEERGFLISNDSFQSRQLIQGRRHPLFLDGQSNYFSRCYSVHLEFTSLIIAQPNGLRRKN